MHRYASLGETIHFWFAANDTGGSAADGATPLFYVRLAGDDAGAAPVLSGTPTLLTHVNYPAGIHEVAVVATIGNGFSTNTYMVACTLLVDSENPGGIVGSFTLKAASSTVDPTVQEMLTGGVGTSTYAGGAVASVTAGVTLAADAMDAAALKADAVTEIATGVLAATVDMPGATDKTVSQVLQAAWAQSAGKWAISGTTLTLYAPDGTTAVATFTLDDADAPTTRTPV